MLTIERMFRDKKHTLLVAVVLDKPNRSVTIWKWSAGHAIAAILWTRVWDDGPPAVDQYDPLPLGDRGLQALKETIALATQLARHATWTVEEALARLRDDHLEAESLGEALTDLAARQKAERQALADPLDASAGDCPMCGVARALHFDPQTRILLTCAAALDRRRQLEAP